VNTYTIALQDDADELGLNRCEVTVQFDYGIDPGDPGCWRTSNGDGWPATPASVEADPCRVVRVFAAGGLPRPLTPDATESVRRWAEGQLEEKWHWIESDILESQPTAADVADHGEDFE